jgi:type IV pilus assembly protein PilV
VNPDFRHHSNPPQFRGQAGSMLLEALIAVLIFSMGILAIVGMQGSAVRATSDAKYRSDASMLANMLIGQMSVSFNRALPTPTPAPATVLQANFQGGSGTNGAAYTAWLANVVATLPSADANPPTVTVFAVPTGAATDPPIGQVTIVIHWNLPGDLPHTYTTVAVIN